MARKKKQEDPPAGAPEWMATYGDMVTLMLCFFVLLFAMSTTDVSKLEIIAASLGQDNSIIDLGVGDSIMEMMGNGIIEMPISKSKDDDYNKENDNSSRDKDELEEMAEALKTYVLEESTAQNIVIDATEYSINLKLGDMFFDSGSDKLRAEAIEVLGFVAKELSKYPDYAIYIEGHTDNRPINTVRFPDNWDLASGRATSVARFFIGECSIDPQRITAISRGEYSPIATNDTPEGRQENRRVEIKIVKTEKIDQ